MHINHLHIFLGKSLIPDLSVSTFSFSPFSVVFTVDLSCIAFIMLRYLVSIPILLIFFHKWMLNSVKFFFCSIKMMMWILHSVDMVYYLFGLLNYPYISGINPTCSWFIKLFMYCYLFVHRN